MRRVFISYINFSVKNEYEISVGSVLNVSRTPVEGVNFVSFTTSRLSQSPNNELSNIETYYRINVFIPFLEFFISQLNERFNKHESVFLGFQCLFEPVDNGDTCKEKLYNLAKFYCEDMQSPPGDIFIELKLWQNVVQRQETLADVFQCATKALDLCDPTLFPNIYRLLKILCTLPVTTFTPERTFSTLRRTKTYLRNTTGQTRLNGLALLSVHREIAISSEDVIDDMAEKPRKF